MEFTYNNSYYASISMAPFEALYGISCQTSLCRYLVLAFSMWHNFINIFFFRPTIFFMKRWSVDNLCYSCGWHKFVIVSWYVCFGCVISLSWCSFSNIYCYHNWVQICANLTITDLFHLIVCPVILIKLIEPLCCQSNLYCVNWFN